MTDWLNNPIWTIIKAPDGTPTLADVRSAGELAPSSAFFEALRAGQPSLNTGTFAGFSAAELLRVPSISSRDLNNTTIATATNLWANVNAMNGRVSSGASSNNLTVGANLFLDTMTQAVRNVTCNYNLYYKDATSTASPSTDIRIEQNTYKSVASAAGNISNLYYSYLELDKLGGETITNVYGVYILMTNLLAPITNIYSLYSTNTTPVMVHAGNVRIGGSIAPTQTLNVGQVANTTGTLGFGNSASNFGTILQAGNATAAVTYTLPTGAPAATGGALTSSTAGVMSWSQDITTTGTPQFTRIGIGTAAGASALITETGTVDPSGATNWNSLIITESPTGAVSTAQQALVAKYIEKNTSTDGSGNRKALQGYFLLDATNTKNQTGTLIPVDALYQSDAGAVGTMNAVTLIRAVISRSGGETITTLTGLDLGNITGGATNKSITSGGGSMTHVGTVAIGSSTIATNALDVTGGHTISTRCIVGSATLPAAVTLTAAVSDAITATTIGNFTQASTGDAAINFAIGSTTSFAMGLDNSVSGDPFTISTAAAATAALGTNSIFSLTTLGAMGVGTAANALATNAFAHFKVASTGLGVVMENTNASDTSSSTFFGTVTNVAATVSNVSIEALSATGANASMVFRTGSATQSGYGTERMRILATGPVSFANEIRVGGSTGGAASNTTFTNATNTTITNAYIVKGGQAASTVNTGWIKIFVGTVASWLPYWSNATP